MLDPDCTVGRALGVARAIFTPDENENDTSDPGSSVSLVRRPRASLRHVIFFSAKRAPGARFMHAKHLQYNDGVRKMFEAWNAQEAAAAPSGSGPDAASLKPRFIFHDTARDPAMYPTSCRELYRMDGVHLNRRGYMVLNNRLQDILRSDVSLDGLPAL